MDFEGIKDGFILQSNNKYIFIYLKDNEIFVKSNDSKYTDNSIYITCMVLYTLMNFTDIKKMFKENICNNRFKEYTYKDCKEYILKKQIEQKHKNEHTDIANMFIELIHS